MINKFITSIKIIFIILTSYSSVTLANQNEKIMKISEPMKCAAANYLITGAFIDNKKQARVFEISQEVAGLIYGSHVAKKTVTRGTINRLKSEALDWLGRLYDNHSNQKVEGLPINMGILKLTEIMMNCDRWIGRAEVQIRKLVRDRVGNEEGNKILLTKIKIPVEYKKFKEFKDIKLLVWYSKAFQKGIDFWNKSGRMTPYKFKLKLKNKLNQQ